MKATEKMIGDVPGNVLGMLADLNLKLKKGVLIPKQLEMFLKKKNPFTPQNAVSDYSQILFDWKEVYSGLGIKCNFSKVVIPDDPGGFERVIIVAQGVGPQEAYDKCQGLFACSKWTDRNLDEIVISDRNAKNGPYAIRVCDLIEADEELENLSANDIKEEKIITETLEERLIHEIKFFKETGKHPDRNITHITICSGSYILVGGVQGVPTVFWDENYDRLRVNLVYLNSVGVNLRARRTVA